MNEVMQRFDIAARYREDALAISRKLLGDDHPDIDGDLFGLGSIAQKVGDWDRAEELYLQVLEYERARYGDHPFIALTLNNLGIVYKSVGRVDEARAVYEEALAINREFLEPDNPEIATTLANLGNVYKPYDLARAEACYREAHEIRAKVFPEGHATRLASAQQLATLLLDSGKVPEAREAYRELIEVRRARASESRELGTALLGLATADYAMRDWDEAITNARESIEVYRRILPEKHLDVARPLRLLGWCAVVAGRPAEGEAPLREALEIRSAELPDDHHDIAQTRVCLAICLAWLEQYDEALELFDLGIAFYDARYGPSHPTTTKYTTLLADALEAGSLDEEAAAWRDR